MVQRQQVTLRMLAAVLVAAGLLGCAEEPEAPPVKWRTTTELPADFPKDLPVYPDAKIEGVVLGEGVPTEEGAYVSWSTKDEVPAVRHFYTEKLDGEGWHVISYPGVATSWMGEGGVTVVATKWGRTAAFAIGAKDGSTLISLVFPGKG